MSIETHLNVEIESEFAALSGMEVGTEAYKTTVDGLTKLLDRAIQIDENEVKREERVKSEQFEAELKQQEVELKKQEMELKITQMNEEKVDRWVKHGLTAAGIIIPTVVTIWGTLKSLEFEKEGTITTIMGRGFFQKLLPKK